jgi:hypothetical protein
LAEDGQVKHEFAVPFSHSQFYLGDDNLDWDPSAVWNAKAVKQLFAPMAEAVGIATVREYGFVRVVVEVKHSAPALSLDKWDQIVECGIRVRSGRLRLSSPRAPDIEPAIDVPPGSYRLRVLYGNVAVMRDRLARATEEEFCSLIASNENAENRLRDFEHFRLVLWPGKRGRVVFLKRAILRAGDDFGEEIEAQRRNKKLMKFLDERAKETDCVPLEEVERQLGLNTPAVPKNNRRPTRKR